ncbi:MAG: hypothetical protein HZA53_05855 [Planctomycetes bacterium]|nr:hypothetical protein [Planctomycetota bacterium]
MATALAACRATPGARPIPLEQVASFGTPIALEAAGEPIDVTKFRGYAGPALYDLDRDGRLDLFVGSFAGKVLHFRNVGDARAPAFAPGELLRADGADLALSNW